MLNEGIIELNGAAIDMVAGGECDSIRGCAEDAGQWVANRLEDAWEWLTE